MLLLRRPLFTSAVLRNAPTGSAKLFADAAQEEEQLPAPRAHTRPEEPNWTGDERIEDTVLRMLVDKYKPLRTGTIQTADQKLRKAPSRVQEYHPDAPMPVHVNTPVNAPPPGASWASVPLLPPGPPDHRPWHTEFKAPAHATPSIRSARFPLPAHAPRGTADLEQTRKIEKALNKTLGRLARARESTLDYRLGLGARSAPASRPNPVNMKGWTSLIEDRIEQARRAGAFASIKGRGAPLVRAPEESNPFLPREEFLMNRIIRRNGAAPPWVQLQADLDMSLHTFRHILQDAWTRHAVRALTLHGSTFNISTAAAEAFRDPTWAARHASYHAVALAEVNERVRAYNALAPYAVRRPLYVLEDELRRVYQDAGAEIAEGVAERARVARPSVEHKGGAGGADWADWAEWMRDLLRRVMRLLGR
ncbi:hypothetical protein DFH09DRAFT_1124958 [Mycena vulgaris]|nr:hypothetical protein DFH09DRAFT_1124958 [Mycena vulgaris]